MELQTIGDCSFSPCIDPVFGPTAASLYWSSTTGADDPSLAWIVTFANEGVGVVNKRSFYRVRAVPGGS